MDASQLTQRDLSRYFYVAPGRPALCSDHRARENARTHAYTYTYMHTYMIEKREKERFRRRLIYLRDRDASFFVLVSQSAAKFRGEIESNRIVRRRNLPGSRHVEMINRRDRPTAGGERSKFYAVSHDYSSYRVYVGSNCCRRITDGILLRLFFSARLQFHGILYIYAYR